MEEIVNMHYNTVCAAPGGNGFRVEHMPDFLMKSDIDDCSPHVHSFYEILWFMEGEGIHTVDFIDYKVKKNTIFFLSPGQIHNFDKNVDKETNTCNYRGLTIKMCNNFLRDENLGSNAILKYDIFHTFDTLPYYHLDDDTAHELKLLVKQMEEESYKASTFGNIDILQSLLRIFLVKIHRHGKQEGERKIDELKASHVLFVGFRRLVEKEFRRIHSVQDYAKELGVSVRTLSKSVNDCSHKTPLAFINGRIMLEAKRLVRHTNMLFRDICFELGYDDPSYFVKQFKRETGYLPSDFREADNVTTLMERNEFESKFYEY